MTVTKDDFNKIWASTSSVPTYTFSDTDYQNGWEFVGNLPPTRAMWDEIQRKNDEKMQLLYNGASFWVDSVADLRTADAEIGTVYATKGYYEPNDGGNGFYYIQAKEVGDTDDGGSVIFLDNDNEAKLITDGTVNVEQFGAVGDGVADDSTAVQNAINTGFEVRFAKNYVVVDVTFPSNAYIFGEGKIIQKATDNHTPAFSVTDKSNLTIKDITLQSQSYVYNTRTNGAFCFTNCANANIENIKIVSNADRNIVCVNSENIYGKNIASNGSGTSVTMYNCNDSTVTDVTINGDGVSAYHGFDVYAEDGETCSNIVVKNIHGNNVASNVLQVTANESSGASFTDCDFSSISAVNSGTAFKTDGLNNVVFRNISAFSCDVLVTAGGTSTVNPPNVVVENCYFEKSTGTSAGINTSANDLTIKDSLFVDVGYVCSDNVGNNITIVGNGFKLNTAGLLSFGKDGSHPKKVIFTDNVLEGETTSVRYPSNSEIAIISDNKINIKIDTTTIPSFRARDYLVLSNNKYSVTSMPSSFRIYKPTWYDGADVATTVVHYGNTVNDSFMSIYASGSTTYTEKTYTIQS